MRNDTPTRPEARPPAHRSRWRQLTAAASTLVLASGLTMAGAVPAQAVPGDVSEGLGKFLGGEAAGIDLDSIAEVEGAYAENPSGVNPVDANPLSAEVLNSVGVDLNDSLQLFGPNGVIELGAVNQFGQAEDSGYAAAASGAVNDQGAISFGGSQEFPSNAEVNLTALLGSEFQGSVTDLALSLGALSSSAVAEPGQVPTSDYQIAGAKLELDSPLVDELVAGVNEEVVPNVDGAVATLTGPGGALAGALDDVDGLSEVLGPLASVEPQIEVDLELEEVLAPVLQQQFGQEGVVLDLENGTVSVDLDTILGGEGSLNAFGPNTEVIDDAALLAISNGLESAVDDVSDAVLATIEQAVRDAELSIDLEASVAEGLTTLDIDVDATLGQIAGEDVPEGGASVSATLLGVDVEVPAGDLVNALAAPINEALFADESGVVSNLDETLSGVTAPTLTGLSPIFSTVDDIVSLVVNVQDPAPAQADATFTQRAATLSLLSGATPLAQVDLASSTVRSSDVQVPAFDTAITADPSTVEQGESTEITGDGFAAEESVTVSIPGAEDGDDPITVETTTNADGEFTTDLPIPADYPTEDVTVTAVGAESETPATTGITVVAPGDGGDGDDGDFDTAITADPSTVEQGESTEITGDGFAAEESVTVSIPGAEDGDDPITVETTTNADGEFTADLPIPADYPTEDVTVTAVGAESETPATTGITVVAPGEGPGDGDDGEDGAFDTDIVAEPTNVEQGGSTEITGIGFASEETVTVGIPGAEDGDDPITVETTTNSDGRFTVDLPVPADYPLGEVVVTAVGAESETPAGTELNVVAPGDGGDDEGDFDTAVVVDPSTVEQGDSTEVTGIGFAPEETVTVSIPGAEDGDDSITVETTTDGDGGFTVDLPVPADYPTGDVVVTAVGDESETPATTDLSIVAPGGGNGGDDDDSDVDPSVSVDPEIAAPGEDVTIEGDDFTPGTTVDIEITDESGDVIGTIEDVEVNDDGEFTEEWTVPEGTEPGDLTVTAEDEEGNSASAPLVIVGDGGSGDEDGTDEPSVSVDPDTAEPGDTVTVEGDDFTPGTTVDVEVTDEDGNVVGTIEDIEVDENGEFIVDWAIPEDIEPGELVVTATDEDGNSASAPLEVLGAGSGGNGDGVPVESDSDDDGAAGSGPLATTGATVATLGLVALVLTLIGIGLYVASRQRRVTDHE